MRKTVRTHDTNGPPKASNKKRALKLGAIAAGAMLVVGAISLFDTASAYGDWEPVDPEVTTTTNGPDAPSLDGRDPNRFQWYQTHFELGTPGDDGTVGDVWRLGGVTPGADAFQLPDGAEAVGAPTLTNESRGSGEFEYTYELTGTEVYNMRGNPQLGGARPGPEHPNWSPTPIPGAIPAHARARVAALAETAETAGDVWVIYNTSDEWQGGNNQGNQGAGSWFKIRGIYTEVQGDEIPEFEWALDWEIPATPDVYHWQLQEKVEPEVTLRSEYLVELQLVGGGNVQPGGALGTEEFTPEVWNFNSARGAIEHNRDDAVPRSGQVEGVPFEQGQGPNNSGWFLLVRVDGDAFRAAAPARDQLTVLLPDGGTVQLRNVSGNTWEVVSAMTNSEKTVENEINQELNKEINKEIIQENNKENNFIKIEEAP